MMNRTRVESMLFFLCLLDPQIYVHITRLFQEVFFPYPTMTLVEYFKSHFRLHAIIMRFSVFFHYTDSTSNGLITRDRAKEQEQYCSYIKGMFRHFKTIVYHWICLVTTSGGSNNVLGPSWLGLYVRCCYVFKIGNAIRIMNMCIAFAILVFNNERKI